MRLRHCFWGAVAVPILLSCSGQGCGTQSDDPNTTPIPEGVYSGYVKTDYLFSVNNEEVGHQVYESVGSIMFGAEGMPLTNDGQPYYVGYKETVETGGSDITKTVKSIVTISTGLRITYDVSMNMYVEGVEGTIPLTGEGTETMSFEEDGGISAYTDIKVGGVNSGDFITYSVVSTGYYK